MNFRSKLFPKKSAIHLLIASDLKRSGTVFQKGIENFHAQKYSRIYKRKKQQLLRLNYLIHLQKWDEKFTNFKITTSKLHSSTIKTTIKQFNQIKCVPYCIIGNMSAVHLFLDCSCQNVKSRATYNLQEMVQKSTTFIGCMCRVPHRKRMRIQYTLQLSNQIGSFRGFAFCGTNTGNSTLSVSCAIKEKCSHFRLRHWLQNETFRLQPIKTLPRGNELRNLTKSGSKHFLFRAKLPAKISEKFVCDLFLRASYRKIFFQFNFLFYYIRNVYLVKKKKKIKKMSNS